MKQVLRLCGAAALAMAAGPALAAPSYTANVIFGDSLSDNGNLAEALGHNFQSPPFNHDSFTNGKTAVEVLDDHLGLPTNPSLYATGGVDANRLGLTAGTNFAVAGATASSAGGVPGGNLPTQVGAYLAAVKNMASASSLYTFFIGGNDVRAAAHQNDASLVTTGEATEFAAIKALLNAGASNLLIVNVPNIGVIPESYALYPATAGANGSAAAMTTMYNDALAADVATLRKSNPSASITYFDLFAFQKGLLADPGQYGITDTTTPCYTSYADVRTTATGYTTSTACASSTSATGNIDHLAFWDAIHPTATVDRAIGDALFDAVAGVPEPSTWATMLVGFGMLGGALRRRRRVASPALA